MNGPTLQDKISRGMGIAARQLGEMFSVYRPCATTDPLNPRNRLIRLAASFNMEDERYRRASGYGKPIWWGVYDASYTQAGDYLVGTTQTFFVASQRPLLPVQCVLTNRVVNILRATLPTPGGYAGMVQETGETLIGGWPASLLELGGREPAAPAGSRFGSWTMLLPHLPARPQIGDLVVDDVAQTYVIGGAEYSDLGERIVMRQIGG